MVSVSGSGKFFIGQSDFLSDNPNQKVKLRVEIGNRSGTFEADLKPGAWHHVAVVKSSSGLDVYLDGSKTDSSLSAPGSSVPSGTVRFGKDTFDADLDGGGRQFYGLLDDVAFFTAALSATRAANLAIYSANHLTGSEQNLHAGYTFGYIPSGGLKPKLSPPGHSETWSAHPLHFRKPLQQHR